MRSRWEENTGPELASAIATDPVVIVPVGSVEQHGGHIPVGCDAMAAHLVSLRAAEAAERSPRVLVLPPLWYGYSPHHMAFAGTVTLGSETFITVLCDIAESLLRQGVRRVLLLNGHGGNVASIDVAACRVGEKWHGRARVAAATYFHLVAGRTAEFRDSEPGGMGHAGEFETSLMLAAYPELVRMEQATTHYPETPSTYLATDLFAAPRVRAYADFKALSPTGTFGDPSLASRDKGEAILDACVDELLAFVRDFADWPMT